MGSTCCDATIRSARPAAGGGAVGGSVACCSAWNHGWCLCFGTCNGAQVVVANGAHVGSTCAHADVTGCQYGATAWLSTVGKEVPHVVCEYVRLPAVAPFASVHRYCVTDSGFERTTRPNTTVSAKSRFCTVLAVHNQGNTHTAHWKSRTSANVAQAPHAAAELYANPWKTGNSRNRTHGHGVWGTCLLLCMHGNVAFTQSRIRPPPQAPQRAPLRPPR